MRRTTNHILTLTLALSLLTLGVGCAARFTAYDAAHGDSHLWDSNEDHAYHAYWQEQHSHDRYVDYKKLNADQQKDYWNWRHSHPDAH